jgi:hypothetical protein
VFCGPRRELRLKGHPQVVVDTAHQLEQALHFVADLLRHDETVTVVL